MNIYAIQGYTNFILILGHKSHDIVNYFDSIENKYNIKYEFVNENMNTGGALKLAEKHINHTISEKFFCTYCDSLGNINLKNLTAIHNNSDNIATITAVHPNHIFGIISLRIFSNNVKSFQEKPKMREWINGGFFLFSNEIFNYILKEEDRLEDDVFTRLTKINKIGIYKHKYFWDTLNTLKDEHRINEEYANTIVPEWYNIK